MIVIILLPEVHLLTTGFSAPGFSGRLFKGGRIFCRGLASLQLGFTGSLGVEISSGLAV